MNFDDIDDSDVTPEEEADMEINIDLFNRCQSASMEVMEHYPRESETWTNLVNLSAMTIMALVTSKSPNQPIFDFLITLHQDAMMDIITVAIKTGIGFAIHEELR